MSIPIVHKRWIYRVVKLSDARFQTQFASKYLLERLICGWHSHWGYFKDIDAAIKSI